MIQTQENGERHHCVSDLGPLAQIKATKFFYSKIWLCQSLDIMVSYHHVQQYRTKLMI